MNWIRIEDKLPDDQLNKDGAEDILIWNGDTQFAVYRHGKFQKRDWLGKWKNVTHWMPISKPND